MTPKSDLERITHDLNNLLHAIITFADLVQREVGDRPMAGGDLAELQNAARQARELVEELREIALQQASR